MDTRATVLVIDDDFDFLEFARIVLESQGYQVLTVEDADEGLTMMRQVQPDLVLLDVVISYAFSGLNAIQEIRNDPQLKTIPLILVSAIVSSEDQDLFPPDEHLHASFFMSKPIEPVGLLSKVEELISRRGQSI